MTPIYKQYKDSNYLVSCFGTIRTKDKFKLVKSFPNHKNLKRAHLKVTLSLKGKKKNIFVHRLVAFLWVPKKRGKDIVNHLDADRFNNFWTNFEWTDISGNTKHAVENGLIDMNYVRSCRKQINKLITYDENNIDDQLN